MPVQTEPDLKEFLDCLGYRLNVNDIVVLINHASGAKNWVRTDFWQVERMTKRSVVIRNMEKERHTDKRDRIWTYPWNVISIMKILYPS